MGCCNTSAVLKTATVLILPALGLHVAAFTLPRWSTNLRFGVSFGLWKFCTDGFCTDIPHWFQGDDLRFAQAMATIGLIFQCVTMIGLLVCLFWNDKMTKVVVCITALFSSITILTLVIGWTVYYNRRLFQGSYSVYLSGAGSVLSFITAILIGEDVRNS